MRSLIGPSSVLGPIAPDGNAVIDAIPLIGAIGRVFRSLEQREVDILARNILYRRVTGFGECQSLSRFRDDPSGDLDDHLSRVGHDGNRMVRTGELHWFCRHDASFPGARTLPSVSALGLGLPLSRPDGRNRTCGYLGCGAGKPWPGARSPALERTTASCSANAAFTTFS